MNKKTELVEERKLISLIKNRHQCKNGFIKCWKNITLSHWITTCQLAHKLINNKWKVFSECEFQNKSRADLCAISGSIGIIYEIMESEKDENIEKKREKYPKEFLIIPVRCSEFNYADFDI